VPNSPSDTARFTTSSKTAISISANTEVNSIQFAPGGSAFTITAPPLLALTVSGAGVINTSGTIQNFVTAVDVAGNHGMINFTNSAIPGAMTAFTNNGQLLSGSLDGWHSIL
jgi:hypothetical protein